MRALYRCRSPQWLINLLAWLGRPLSSDLAP
jgi:hypothetical protein